MEKKTHGKGFSLHGVWVTYFKNKTLYHKKTRVYEVVEWPFQYFQILVHISMSPFASINIQIEVTWKFLSYQVFKLAAE